MTEKLYRKQSIGGFLRPAPIERSKSFLASGRSALRAILEHLGSPLIHVPHYTCPVVHELIDILNLRSRRYHIDPSLRPELPAVGPDEVVLLNNYFGCYPISSSQNGVVVCDHAQAYFAQTPPNAWAFTSARKFFPVADGAFFEGPEAINLEGLPYNAVSGAHLVCDVADAYQAFQHAESQVTSSLLRGSSGSLVCLSQINMTTIIESRRANWQFLHDELAGANMLCPQLSNHDVPMAYPFLPRLPISHNELHRMGIWVPRFWQDLDHSLLSTFERHLSEHLLPLPCDQRYDRTDMTRMLVAIAEIQGSS